ncbi:thioredoxin domain-containing protein [Alteraurantiacibacter buctensis]|uniref:Thioredoxin domain-containing protein n=1 Tax=Alteraurantiacibacter buctensis TaxID=1503981 RepID=A0A844YW09_9SPHN|nr:thioredoxin domain-containing protein [Alteraurantiacibacter buctensis]
MKLKTALSTLMLALAALALAAVAASPAAAQSQPRRNWLTTMTETTGGHLLGNPQAATKLTVFISYTCPHCASFEAESDGPLRAAYIQPGRVSLEVRPFLRNVLDLAATLAVECGPESRFWGNHRAMLRGQDAWMQRATGATQAQQQRWSTGPVGQRLRAVAGDMGWYELLAPRGYSRADLDRCLNDEAAARALSARSQADGTRFNIPGTPALLINDRLQANVYDWAALRPLLDAATR